MEDPSWARQEGFEIRCEWGEEGVRLLAPMCRVVVIVDVLSFSTAVSVAVDRGAVVYPYRFKDATAADFADSVGAVLAGSREAGGFSLSPVSLHGIPSGTRLVLPSPNGAVLTLLAGATPVIAGCLRNAPAVARAAEGYGGPIAVIPAGERWPDGSLRPAIEDLIGAGAIIHQLSGRKSPEAEAAEHVFMGAMPGSLSAVLSACMSGQELKARGQEHDVVVASALGGSETVPVLRSGAFRI